MSASHYHNFSLVYCAYVAATLLLARAHFVSHRDCNNVASGTIVANPANCSQYIQCNGLRSTLGECPDGKYFNPALLSCGNSRHACKSKAAAEQPPTDMTTTAATTAAAATSDAPTSNIPARPSAVVQRPVVDSIASVAVFGRPICTVWHDQQFPHPYNCEYYYHCISGLLSVRRCYFGFGWDLVSQRCVPKQLANCFRARFSV